MDASLGLLVEGVSHAKSIEELFGVLETFDSKVDRSSCLVYEVGSIDVRNSWGNPCRRGGSVMIEKNLHLERVTVNRQGKTWTNFLLIIKHQAPPTTTRKNVLYQILNERCWRKISITSCVENSFVIHRIPL